MKLLHDYIHDPLKQTKRTLWCFARLTINSVSGCFRRFSGKFLKQTERLKRSIRLFSWLENSRRKFGFHVFKPFLNISFRLSQPFFLTRNWLRQIQTRLPNGIKIHQSWILFTICPNREATGLPICKKYKILVSKSLRHSFLSSLGTFLQRAVRG